MTSRPVTRLTGACRESSARSMICAEISAPNPQKRAASCTITARPVFFTLPMTVSWSNGESVRTSITSTS